MSVPGVPGHIRGRGISGACPNSSPAHTAPRPVLLACHHRGVTSPSPPTHGALWPPAPPGPMCPLTWGAAGSSKVGAQPAEEEEEGREEGARHRHGGVSRGARANSLRTQPTAQGCRLPHLRRFLPHGTARRQGAHPTQCPTGHSNGDHGSPQWGPTAHPTGALPPFPPRPHGSCLRAPPPAPPGPPGSSCRVPTARPAMAHPHRAAPQEQGRCGDPDPRPDRGCPGLGP